MSKAWAAAFTEISADLSYEEKNHMPTLTKLLPQTARLQYNITHACSYPLNLSALGCFARLRDVMVCRDVSPVSKKVAKLDIGSLPKTLSRLEIKDIVCLPNSARHLQCTDLKRFSYWRCFGRDDGINKVLPYLTKLEVSPTFFPQRHLLSALLDLGQLAQITALSHLCDVSRPVHKRKNSHISCPYSVIMPFIMRDALMGDFYGQELVLVNVDDLGRKAFISFWER